MNIGIDIDGVLTDFAGFIADFGGKYFIKERGKHFSEPLSYYCSINYNVTLEDDIKFWNDVILTYIKQPPRYFASEVIKQLKLDGHKIFIITNRACDNPYTSISQKQMKKAVKNWLKKYKIPYDKLIFSTGKKLKELSENKIDIMIEDSPANIIAQCKHTKIFVYDARYNKEISPKEAVRVFSWYDIYDKIKAMN